MYLTTGVPVDDPPGTVLRMTPRFVFSFSYVSDRENGEASTDPVRAFDRIGVFVDCLTKWPEVFAVVDQTSVTIARLLVEEVVSRHRVPTEVLSDRGKAFLSGLMQEVGLLLGYRKVRLMALWNGTVVL